MSSSIWRRFGAPFLLLHALFAQWGSADALFARAAPGKNGAVASENYECTNIGIDLLKQGGTAADALVGTVFCVGVIGMWYAIYHSGIGGGGFGLLRLPNGEYKFVDFREVAPAAASKNMYKGNYNGSLYGGLSSGVPGELRGLQYIHENYGKLPWKTVMQGAINLARHGFKVDKDLVMYMKEGIQEAGMGNFLVNDPSFAVDFAPNGTLVKLGDIMTRKRYADTLEAISKGGPDAFYSGSIAEATINAVQGSDGIMTMADLAAYKAAVREPEQITYRDYKITSGRAPSSGAVVLAVMKTVEGYHTLGEHSALNISTHRLDEAIRWGYAERAHLGDPTFVAGVTSYEAGMISAKTAAKTRSKITHFSHPVKYYNPDDLAIQNTPGTSQVAIADRDGMAVSLTTTVNLLFGSLLCVPETGVIMNDEMNDFSIPGASNSFGYIPSEANYIRPGKRPLSSISPTIVEHRSNGSLYFVTGAAGGSRIITATIQSLWHVLDQGMDLTEALAAKRFHDQLVPNTIQLERGYNRGVAEFLRERRHNVTHVPVAESEVQAVRLLPDGTFEAAGDPRQVDSLGKVY